MWDEIDRFIKSPRIAAIAMTRNLANIVLWNDHDCADRDEAAQFLRNEAKRYREEVGQS
jgi:hypothetical protein